VPEKTATPQNSTAVSTTPVSPAVQGPKPKFLPVTVILTHNGKSVTEKFPTPKKARKWLRTQGFTVKEAAKDQVTTEHTWRFTLSKPFTPAKAKATATETTKA
jgi:hypothetical protein